MKRFFVSFCVAMLALMGTVYAEEQEVVFFRNAEIILQDRPICRDGKWMVSLRDLERLTDTQAMKSENGIIFRKSVMRENSVGLQKEGKAYFLSDGMLLEAIDGGAQKLDGKETVAVMDETNIPLAEVNLLIRYQQAQMEKLIDAMEDDDDVQNVWHNWDQE